MKGIGGRVKHLQNHYSSELSTQWMLLFSETEALLTVMRHVSFFFLLALCGTPVSPCGLHVLLFSGHVVGDICAACWGRWLSLGVTT